MTKKSEFYTEEVARIGTETITRRIKRRKYARKIQNMAIF